MTFTWSPLSTHAHRYLLLLTEHTHTHQHTQEYDWKGEGQTQQTEKCIATISQVESSKSRRRIYLFSLGAFKRRLGNSTDLTYGWSTQFTSIDKGWWKSITKSLAVPRWLSPFPHCPKCHPLQHIIGCVLCVSLLFQKPSLGGKRRIFSKVSSSTHRHESTSTSHNRQAKTGQALLRVAAMQRCTVMQEERWVENGVGGTTHR